MILITGATPFSTCSSSRVRKMLLRAEPALVGWQQEAGANDGSRRPISTAMVATAAFSVLPAAN